MSLFNKRLLHDTVTKYKHEVQTTTKQDLQALFKETLNRIETGKFKKEESEKVPFLQRLFELLGYKLHENLEFEYSTSFGRSIDGVLGLQIEKERNVEIAIEWKGIDTKSLDKGKAGETPVSQMWDYMGKVGAEIGIVGNFLEFRIYTLKTKQTEYQEYFLRELTEKGDKLDEFIFLLKKQTLLKNNNKQSLLENLISQSEAEQEQITKRFYNDYKQRRLNLFQHLVENNPDINKHILVEKSQKILDRLIFVMFCEDGFLIPSGTVKNTYTQARNTILPTPTKIWDFFKGLFLAIDKGNEYPKINAFNGGLFAEDTELNNLIIKDNIWQDLTKLAEYDFESDLNVNILGHIFEQSISDIEEIKNEIEGETTDKKKSKRKKDGIYYTPEYITDYIVSETIGNWLNQESNQVEQIKVLDPAGGSGAFPNQVHNYLTKEYVKKQNELAIEQGFENFVGDETTIDKSILKNNIFMVDLQPESVEIAKLSLWLKTAKKDQKLNNLDDNVKCGNSLISDPEIAGYKAFDWHKEFPEVMASGGFDVIVGNPPWGAQFDEKTKKYILENFETAEYQSDSYVIFIERALNLLRENGYLSFIVPSTWLNMHFFQKIRKKIVFETELKEVILLNYKVFEEATAETCIFVCKKIIPNSNNKIKLLVAEKPEDLKSRIREEISQKFWQENFENGFNPYFDEEKYISIQKIFKNSLILKEIVDTTVGIKPYQTNKGKPKQTPYEVENRVFDSPNKKDDLYKEYLVGSDFNKYQVFNHTKKYLKYGEWLAEPRNFDFSQEKIIIRQTSDKIIAAIDNNGYLNLNNVHNLALKKEDQYNLKFILGVLNSQTIDQIYKFLVPEAGRVFAEVKAVNLAKLPIPKATIEQQAQIAELVDQIMILKGNSQNLTNSFLKLITAKYKPTTISTKLKNWHKLEIADFLDELKKQKALIGGLSAESELIAYFDEQKAKVLEVEKEAERVDGEIEGLVRGLYKL